MKSFKLILTSFILTAAVLAPLAYAADASSELIAQGRDLFNKKEGLGSKFACILCHKADKAIKLSDVNKAGEGLPAVINKYLTQKSKGPALAADSEKMKALIAYIKYEHAK